MKLRSSSYANNIFDAHTTFKMFTCPKLYKIDLFYLFLVADFRYCCLMHVLTFQTFCRRAHCLVYFIIIF